MIPVASRAVIVRNHDRYLSAFMGREQHDTRDAIGVMPLQPLVRIQPFPLFTISFCSSLLSAKTKISMNQAIPLFADFFYFRCVSICLFSSTLLRANAAHAAMDA